MPESVTVVAVVAGLIVGLAALCCCFGEHTVAHVTGRSAVSGVMASDSTPDMLSDLVIGADAADQDARRSGDGCGHPADSPAAVVASSGASVRDLAAGTMVDIYRPGPAAAGPPVAVGGVAARAPASHLLCIMRT